ncbi:hypothetical protein [Sphingopyxis sp. MSC1_008]|jgi:uncharacterized membrane protein YhaH (DUF805 family)|uniref:hypothetical protein n=1 Tax=Sphingopyxis sp. MSC1_008 TaxID=2909265 RepID=UPI0020BEEC35|nr:hypothetical protein [Sphingopyxis sp. MSC1_008]
MKIDIRQILWDHFGSLKDEETRLPMGKDYFIFYVVPGILGSISFFKSLSFDKDAYNVSITFFGIFIALLLNIQVAIFSIYQRKWKDSEIEAEKDAYNYELNMRRRLLGQLNSNISYLVLVCCASLILSISCYIGALFISFPSAILVFLYAHFVLTLLMIVKRAHALFQREYAEP